MATKANKVNKNSVNDTSVVCPVCGTSFQIPEHEQHVCGTTIAKDSGLGQVFLTPESPSAPKSPVSARIAALKAKGIDTSKYFSASNNGKEVWMKFGDNGVPQVVDEKDFVGLDEIEQGIVKGGYIQNAKLFRRWVMAQMLRAESRDGGLTDYMYRLGYDYSISQTLEEFRVQSILAKKDPGAFMKRNRFFNKDVAVAIINGYEANLRLTIERMPVRHCKGVAYKRVFGKDIFVSDLQRKLYSPLSLLAMKMSNSPSADKTYELFLQFSRSCHRLRHHSTQAAEWKDAFKGAGAYYTLENMIKFHGLRLTSGGIYASLRELEKKTDEFDGAWYRLLGYMREQIKGKTFTMGDTVISF